MHFSCAHTQGRRRLLHTYQDNFNNDNRVCSSNSSSSSSQRGVYVMQNRSKLINYEIINRFCCNNNNPTFISFIGVCYPQGMPYGKVFKN